MTIDEADAKRNRTLTWYAVAFAVWAGSLVALFVLVIDPGMAVPAFVPPQPPRAILFGLLGLLTVGGLAYAGLLVRLMLLGWAVRRDPALAAAASDERARDNQYRAVFFAFWVVITGAALAIPLEIALGMVFTAKTYAAGLIWLGVTSALFAFVRLERRDAA